MISPYLIKYCPVCGSNNIEVRPEKMYITSHSIKCKDCTNIIYFD